MPESMVMVDFPVFFVSAFAVAVIITCRLGYLVGSGNVAGAVYVAVESAVVLVFWMSPSVPTAPFALVHAAGVEALGFGSAVVALGVVVKLQSNVEDTSVAPVTIAVRMTPCVTDSVPPGGLTWTAT